jgi:hypothetical protein
LQFPLSEGFKPRIVEECHDLFLQGSTQFLDLMGLLLNLGLAGPHPLDTILQELGLRLGKGRPLLHQCGLSLSKGVIHLL